MVCASHYFTTKHHSIYGITQWYATYTRITKSPVETRRDPRTNTSTGSNPMSASMFPSMLSEENRKDKFYSPLAYKCRFIGYAIDVNWTNTPQISKANESNFVNYKDSYIILMNGARYIRHDVIFELYQNQPTILKVEPLIIGIYRNLSENCPIISDNFIGSDKFIGWLFSV